jgi:hypothetical protein
VAPEVKFEEVPEITINLAEAEEDLEEASVTAAAAAATAAAATATAAESPICGVEECEKEDVVTSQPPGAEAEKETGAATSEERRPSSGPLPAKDCDEKGTSLPSLGMESTLLHYHNSAVP